MNSSNIKQGTTTLELETFLCLGKEINKNLSDEMEK